MSKATFWGRRTLFLSEALPMQLQSYTDHCKADVGTLLAAQE